MSLWQKLKCWLGFHSVPVWHVTEPEDSFWLFRSTGKCSACGSEVVRHSDV